MDAALLEQLLFEDESTTLDFKRDQYKFVKASDEDKSELLKDILGFVNAWRRSESYILIGVREVLGGRSEVVGITKHLDDHSLQQFVNNQTNQAVRFGYEACSIDGKEIGIIRVEQQPRPVYLKKDYGKLEKEKVYVRRGTSTDPTKPASPEEIAQMGKEIGDTQPEADFSVEFADPDRDVIFGDHLLYSAELSDTPDDNDLPASSRTGETHPLGPAYEAIRNHKQHVQNEDYYKELRLYLFFNRLYRRVRIVVTNTGKVSAGNVRVELIIPNEKGVMVFEKSSRPQKPEKTHSIFQPNGSSLPRVRPIFRDPGYVVIERNDDRHRLSIDFQDLQPGREIWSGVFYLGIGKTGKYSFQGNSFAENLFAPKPFALTVDATVKQTVLAVDELVAYAGESEDGDTSEADNEEDED